VGPTLSRLHVGLYRVLYEISEQEIRVRRVDRLRWLRVLGSGAAGAGESRA